MTAINENKENDPSTFSFPARLNGNDEVITVVTEEGHYNVFLNGNSIAKLKLNEADHTWYVCEGSLPEPAFEQQIGERIEAQYFK